MNIQKILFEILTFGKNFVLTYYFSITRPYRFYFTKDYDRFKINPQTYLYASIFIYLFFFASKEKLFSDPEKAISIVKAFANLTIFDALLYTLPIFLYSLFLIWIFIRPLKSIPWVSDYGFSCTMFSNALNIESSFSFVLAIVFYFIRFEFKKIGKELNGDMSYRFVYAFYNYLIIIIPFWVLFTLRMKKVRLPWLKLLPFVVLCCFSDNIVNSFFSHLFAIVNTERKNLIVLDPSAGTDLINLDCTVLSDTSCIVSGTFFMKNNTNKTLFFDTSTTMLRLESNSIPQNRELDDSTRLFYQQFIQSISPDSFILVTSTPSFKILEPRESVLLHYYRKMDYNIKNVETFLRFRYLEKNMLFYFYLSINLFDEDGNLMYYNPELRILNFSQDNNSINEHRGALFTYRNAERNLKIEGIKPRTY